MCRVAWALAPLEPMTPMLKERIYWQLTHLRDKSWMPSPAVWCLDWLRYEVFYPYA